MKRPIKRGRRTGVRRFYYVTGPRSRMSHMSVTINTGGRTYCGVRIGRSWGWARKTATKRHAKRRVCHNCLRRV